jgi:hypothetical protein
MALEDDPVFDAGTGAHLNRDGHVELDAIVMDGNTLKAGSTGRGQASFPTTFATCCRLDICPYQNMLKHGSRRDHL